MPACFGVGVLWGWLPCGLVYSASLYAFGRQQCLARRAVYAGVYIGDLAEPARDGHICSVVENLSAKRMVRLCAGLLGGRMGDMALGCICDGANRVR